MSSRKLDSIIAKLDALEREVKGEKKSDGQEIVETLKTLGCPVKIEKDKPFDIYKSLVEGGYEKEAKIMDKFMKDMNIIKSS